MKGNVREQHLCLCSCYEVQRTWSQTLHKNSNNARFEVIAVLMNHVFWYQMLSGTLLVPDILDECTAFVFRVEKF
jgi:hypothetical protein